MDKVLDFEVKVVKEDSEWFGKVGHVVASNEPFHIVRFMYWSKEVDGFARSEVTFTEDELVDVRTRAQKESAMFADFNRNGCN